MIALFIGLGAGPPIYSKLSGGDFYSIPAGSMKPTLLIGDQVLAKPLDRDLRRGDIIIFNHPTSPEVDYIKRIIALPGDTFTMRDGFVSLNDVALVVEQTDDFEEPYKPGQAHKCNNYPKANGNPCKIAQWLETLPNGRSYRILDHGITRADNTDQIAVPKDRTLVLGDNRDNSVDSRFPSVGLVPIENVKHLAYMIHTSNDPDTVSPRWDRIFKRLDTE